jgi:hypothetical protein
MVSSTNKPFLTIETGEAYQPIRLTYDVMDKERLKAILNRLGCIEPGTNSDAWIWYWKEECDDLHFESISSFNRSKDNLLRLGTLIIRGKCLYLNIPSFKRACLAVAFFHKIIDDDIATIRHADFINKLFALDEHVPHSFADIVKEEELEEILKQRVAEYQKIKIQCEKAKTPEEALAILSKYTQSETEKPLPYVERFAFNTQDHSDSEVVFLSFYIFLRSRELVALRRWFGEEGFNLASAADETVEQAFGSIGVDLIE